MAVKAARRRSDGIERVCCGSDMAFECGQSAVSEGVNA